MRALLTPPLDASPVELLTWVRRVELVTGLGCAAIGAWLGGTWGWVLIGIGAVSLSPWPGAGVLLRRARAHPDLPAVPLEERLRSARRAQRWLLPAYALGGALAGYISAGPVGAVGLGGLMTLSGLWGLRLTQRRGATPRRRG